MESAGKVLHVDSDARFRQEFCPVAAERGIACVGEETCAGAAERLKSEGFSCVLLDAGVADMAWEEAIGLFRSIRHGSPVPLVLMTAVHTKDLEAAARRNDVAYYFVKSFEMRELVDAVQEILTASRKGKAMDSNKKTILVIDDDADYQDAVKTILESGGYSVVQAFNKEEGEQKLRTQSPDLVVLDIMMESPSAGFHFLYETLNERKERGRSIPVLAVSAISQKTGFKFAPTADEDYFPADDYLEKPVTTEKLLERVGALLKGKRPERK